MNYIDLAILAFIGISVAFGLYSGLISSAVNVGGLIISWICAGTMYTSLSRWIVQNTNLLNVIVNYTEGASKIFSLEAANTPVASAASSLISEVVQKAGFPAPFDQLLAENMLSQVYSANGLITIADYFNYTLAFTALNIISFLIILFVMFVLFSIINALVSYVVRFPVIKQCDALLGGAFGLLRGVFLVFAMFMLLPVVLSVVDISFITDMIADSKLAGIFYGSNFILSTIKSVIT